MSEESEVWKDLEQGKKREACYATTELLNGPYAEAYSECKNVSEIKEEGHLGEAVEWVYLSRKHLRVVLKDGRTIKVWYR